MNLKDLNDYLSALPEEILSESADIVAETATEYFKGTFREKAFDGNPWLPGKPKRTGSLLVDSGALVNSIRPVIVSPEKVVIAAGNDHVLYARTHNEGFSGTVSVPSHTRHTRHGDVSVRSHSRSVQLPARPFMGDSEELNAQIHERIEGYINSLTTIKK